MKTALKPNLAKRVRLIIWIAGCHRKLRCYLVRRSHRNQTQ